MRMHMENIKINIVQNIKNKSLDLYGKPSSTKRLGQLRLVIISFKMRTSEKNNLKKDNLKYRSDSVKEIFEEIVEGYNGPQLLLLPGAIPGYTRAHLKEITVLAQKHGVGLIVECENDETKAKRCYLSYDPRNGWDLKQFVQVFHNNKAKKEKVKELLDYLRAGLRTFKNNGAPISILVCGENNILQNRQETKNKDVAVRHFEGKKNLLKNDLSSNIVFNGSHTIMGNWGKLHNRFCKLSSAKRLFIYSTNNTSKYWGKSAIKIYYNGKSIADSHKIHDEKEFQMSLHKNKKSKFQVLTLDLPKSFLRTC